MPPLRRRAQAQARAEDRQARPRRVRQAATNPRSLLADRIIPHRQRPALLSLMLLPRRPLRLQTSFIGQSV